MSNVMDVPVKDDTGYFFSRIGELCLTPESELQSQQRTHAPKNLLVCSNRYGITAFADGRGTPCWWIQMVVCRMSSSCCSSVCTVHAMS